MKKFHQLPCILMRASQASEGEVEAAGRHFDVFHHRADVPKGRLVIPRFSALPYYDELEYDMFTKGAVLANSVAQHEWCADLLRWYEVLHEHTPPSWHYEDFVRRSELTGPFVLKGATNSKKFEWKDAMYAADRRAAIEVACRLRGDSLIGTQEIVVRQYVPLKIRERAVVGPDMAEEYRLFYWRKELLGAGYYWSTAEDAESEGMRSAAIEFGDYLAPFVCKHATFFVLDVAMTADGHWILIEVNDGQQSGLQMVDADAFYMNLADALAWERKEAKPEREEDDE